MQRNSTPLKWQGMTTCDALDGSSGPQGGMALLQNLIPDPSTNGYWQGRPAAVLINAITGSFSPGFISVGKVIGNILYGMVSDGGGLDKPFALNLVTMALIAVTGTQTSATLPATQTYPWSIPAQMDMISTKLMVAHPGFSPTAVASGNYFGWFDLTNPLAPIWNAGQLTGGFVTFSVPPIAVKQFFNRAYYIHNLATAPAVIFSDVLNPINCLNANQVLTFDDINVLTALGQGSLSNLLGGQLQCLYVFKGTQTIYQITGDAALNTLAINRLSLTTGTQSPNSIVSTPIGLAFMSPDGLRIIDFSAKVSDPVGLEGQGVVIPFQQGGIFTICAACSSDILRISVDGITGYALPRAEFWYHFDAKEWTGPHTFSASLIWQWAVAGPGDTFILQANQAAWVGGAVGIWRSDYLQNTGSVFTENGAVISCKWKSVLLPDTEKMNNVCVTESTLDAKIPSGAAGLSNVPTVSVLDQDGFTLSSSIVITPGATGAVQPYEINWVDPLVFARAYFLFSSDAISGLSIGALRMRYQILRSRVDPVVSLGQKSNIYTFDPAFLGTHATLSGGHLILTSDGTANPATSQSTVSALGGRYYAEFKLTTLGAGSPFPAIGIGSGFNVNNRVGDGLTDWGYIADNGVIRNNNANTTIFLSPWYVLNNIVMVAFSAVDRSVWFGLNGVWQTGNPVTSTAPVFVMPVTVGNIFLAASVGSGSAITANFGGAPFVFSVPQGFQPFNTINE